MTKKQRVGILTFHRADNYGAVLQCYALQQAVRLLGYDVQVIDYLQPHIVEQYRPLSKAHILSALRSRPQSLFDYLRNIGYRSRQSPLFEQFRERWLSMTEGCKEWLPQGFDTYLIGSDQLWSHKCTNGLDPIFYGEFYHTPQSRIVAYAISSTRKSIDAIPREQLKGYLSNFSSLSFREVEISQMVTSQSGVPSRVDIDPTLLLDRESWSSIVDSKWASRRYVLLYQLRTKYGRGATVRRSAKRLARAMDCELIDLSQGGYSVEDFVSMFRYAQHVVTSSFHGTAFSLIFERPLYSIMLNDGHDERAANLLRGVGGESMLVAKDFEPTPATPDYTTINKKLSLLKESSLEYLASAL